MKITVYDMELDFDIMICDRQLNNLLESCGVDGKLGFEGFELKLTQTLDVIPSPETIEKYEEVICEKYKTEKMEIVKCNFKGFSKIIPREIEIPDTK